MVFNGYLDLYKCEYMNTCVFVSLHMCANVSWSKIRENLGLLSQTECTFKFLKGVTKIWQNLWKQKFPETLLFGYWVSSKELWIYNLSFKSVTLMKDSGTTRKRSLVKGRWKSLSMSPSLRFLAMKWALSHTPPWKAASAQAQSNRAKCSWTRTLKTEPT